MPHLTRKTQAKERVMLTLNKQLQKNGKKRGGDPNAKLRDLRSSQRFDYDFKFYRMRRHTTDDLIFQT
jgi:hypothetical protein